jgi:hypothetical protein
MGMVINYADKIVQIKIVYYGPAAAGKTTSLQYLASKLNVEVVDMEFRTRSDNDRTVFFEFAPVIQKFGTWSVKLNFFTLPGQLRFAKTRALVLRGAQGIVYVADSQYDAAEENLRMLADLQDNLNQDDLVLEGLSSKTEGVIPIVLLQQEGPAGHYAGRVYGPRLWPTNMERPQALWFRAHRAKCAQSSGFDYLQSDAAIGRKARTGGKGGGGLT